MAGRVAWWDGGQTADTLTTRSQGQRMPDKHQLPCVVDTRWHTISEDGTCPSLLATDYKEPKAVCEPRLVYPIDMMNVDGRGETFKAKCYGEPGSGAYSLTRRRPSGVCVSGVVRRLLPVECERLMGFPDGWTRIAWRGKVAGKCPDGLRYKALGNSMCVNVMAWIGERIAKVDKEISDGRENA